MTNTTLLLIRVAVPLVWALTPIVLAAIGLLNYPRLKSLRRYAIVANLIIAALVTTPEIFTQLVAAIAMQACYEIAVLISWLCDRQKRKRAALNA